MLRSINLSRWALEHTALVRYLMVALLIGGVWSYGQLGQDEDPPFTFRIMALRVFWPGASAQQISEHLVDKLEKKLQETPYINKITSYAKPGETLILLDLQQSTPPKEVANSWYQVRKKIGDIRHTLPAGIQGPVFLDEFGDTFGSIFAFTADGFSYQELKAYVERARQELLRLPDVAKVDLFGVQDEKIWLEVSQAKLAKLGLTVSQLSNLLNATNAIEPAGVLPTPQDNIFIRVTGSFESLSDLAQLVLRVNGRSFKLGDVARIEKGYVDPPLSKMRYGTGPNTGGTQAVAVPAQEVIGLGVSMVKGGDIIALGQALEQARLRIESGLPVGIQIHRVQDQPQAVKRSVSEFVRVLIEAVAVVLVVSFISLGLHTKPWRLDPYPGLVVALTIPLVLAITFLCMQLFAINLHKISLGALIIALGLLVDDAIIAVEMMVRKMEEGLSRFDAATYAYTSTAFPMLTGTLITAAGFLPVGLAKSTAGEYTFSIFAVTTIALLISWVAAVIFTPYLGYLLLKTKPHAAHAHEALFATPFYERFRRAVAWCVWHRKTVIGLTLAALLLGGLGFRYVEQQFFPDSSRPELMVDMWLPEGSSYQASEAEAKRFEAWLAQQPEVESFATFVGVGAPRFYLPMDQQFNQSNLAQLIVLPHDLPARNRLRQKITDLFAQDFPAVRGRARFLPNGPPVPYPVQFRVTGPEIEQVRQIADQVKAIVAKNPHTLGVNDNWNEAIKVLRFQVDQERASVLGINSQQIASALQAVTAGYTIGQFRQGDRLIEIAIRAPQSERAQIDALNNINLAIGEGKSIPLSQLVRPAFAWEPGVIWRYNRDYAITINADVRDGIQGPTVTLQIDPQLAQLRQQLGAGYRIEIAGALEESATAGKSIAANVPLMIFIVLTLLMLQLQSFGRTLLVFITGPLGFIGAAMMLLIMRAPFGFVAQLGVIALLGMIIRNSVILIDQIEHDIKAGVDAWQAIVEAAVRRYRPIMLTAAAAVLAMIPLSRSVFWGPMAIAIMGGLIVATVLTLFFLPALYAACYRVKRPVQ
ncbi:efflux RND transporter permease subunit [Parvibium lacunae]|uniref:AcrB/AcrD/AcrF family protein n=1 Tax=Parvibium lacunae TaxID=1888893 RepID=A0A368L824_9BURK|nr:efflux RND transporter permease subunit [Parvibium lacunae]RCS59815.1 AcrB/AcrD/AcrF family protein [Parvibium lacunae]